VVTEPELCDEPVDEEPVDEEPVDEPLAADESSSPEDDPLDVDASFDVELPVVVELEREVLACCVAFVDADELAPR
jgi:hypothetical protein